MQNSEETEDRMFTPPMYKAMQDPVKRERVEYEKRMCGDCLERVRQMHREREQRREVAEKYRQEKNIERGFGDRS